jgi:uncharacterized protein with NRDE domain
MCTVVVLRRPGHPWPLLLAANRDEMAHRPWRAPGRHWRRQPDVTGGLDETGGGTWLAYNDAGVIAAVLNRINTLGPAPGRLSRGELPLRALTATRARDAAAVIGAVDPRAWRPFNMVVADDGEAFWVRATDGSGPEPPEVVVETLPPGVSMITAYDRDDPASPRIRRYLPQFSAADPPRPERGDWREWIRLLASREADAEAGPGGAMTVITASGFGTVSASLLALSADGAAPRVWLFSDGPPGDTPFSPVPI